MSGRWQIQLTQSRNTTDVVNIVDADGRIVAHWVARADALRMIHDPAQIADDAIGLFLELRDQHGHDEDAARAMAVSEVVEGCAFDEEAFRREMAAEAEVAVAVNRALDRHLANGGSEPDFEDLPY